MAMSSESGIETDGGRYTDSEEKLHIKAIVPDKLAYDSKAPIVIAFNKYLPKSRTYIVDFTGTRRASMQVTATQLNECTLLVQAPVYFPPEDVQVNVYYGVQRKHMGNWNSFKFQSRTDILADLLLDSCDPVTFMCEALNLSPQDLERLDAGLSSAFTHNMPVGFDVLGAHRERIKEETYARYPTLLHFGATFGLKKLVDSLINSNCPGAPQAALLRNCDRMKPQDLARYYGHTEIKDTLLEFEAGNESDPYTDMGSDDTYEAMGQEGEESYVSMQYNEDGNYYTDMSGRHFTNVDSYTDVDGYITTDGREHSDEAGYLSVVGPGGADDAGQGIYEDMDPANQEEYNEQFYEDMSSQDPAAPAVPERGFSAIYDHPSNLPVSDYPLHRSASNSMEMRRTAPQRLSFSKHKFNGNSSPRGSSPKDTDDPSTDNVVVQALETLELSRTSTPIQVEPQSIRRSGSTSSKISNVSTASNTSSLSSSSRGSAPEWSGYGADKEDNAEATHESLSVLQKRLSLKQKNQDGTEAPPAPPPADYESQDRDPAPLPVPPVSSRRPVKPQRPKTAPVNRVDVEKAQILGAPPPLKRRDTAPPPTSPRADKPEKTRALFPTEDRGLPSVPLQDAKRIERRPSDKTKSRPPAPLPGRPAAPPPVEERNPTPPSPAEQHSTVRGGVGPRPLSNIRGAAPTPFAVALERAGTGSPSQQRRPDLGEAPAPPPRAGQRAPLAPPRPQPRH